MKFDDDFTLAKMERLQVWSDRITLLSLGFIIGFVTGFLLG